MTTSIPLETTSATATMTTSSYPVLSSHLSAHPSCPSPTSSTTTTTTHFSSIQTSPSPLSPLPSPPSPSSPQSLPTTMPVPLDMNNNRITIRSFYDRKSILVTGATGFVGRFLVYRLLSTCNVSKIYIVLRSKHGVSVGKRLEKFFKESIFTHLSDPTLLSKVIAVQGDVTLPGLGLSPQDAKSVTEEVSVVFHSAASIRLNQTLKEATKSQVEGTKNVLEVCKKCHRIQSLVYVSSIANWFNKTYLEEKLYSEEVSSYYKDSTSFIRMINEMSDVQAQQFSEQLVGKWPKYPNNYVLTKTLTEVMLEQEGNGLNIAIVRSPLLFSCLKTPEPGWFDVPQTGTAMFSLYANGIIRTAAFDPDYDFNHMPLDMSVNTLIAMGWFMACSSANSFEIFNMNCTRDNPITIKEVSISASRLGNEFPSMRQVRPPKDGFPSKPHPVTYAIHAFFTYTLFSYLLDLYLHLIGQRPMFVKIIQRTREGVAQIEKILREKADVVCDKLNNIMGPGGPISEEERKIFYFNPRDIHWDKLFLAHHIRFRKHVLNEDTSNLPEARRRLRRIRFYYSLVKLILWLAIITLVFVFITLIF